jgi:hypothetical protein
MKIKIDKIKENWYRADFTELCGSPSCGDGKTPEMAVAALFIRHIREDIYTVSRLMSKGPDGNYAENGYLEINGKPYEYPYSTER